VRPDTPWSVCGAASTCPSHHPLLIKVYARYALERSLQEQKGYDWLTLHTKETTMTAPRIVTSRHAGRRKAPPVPPSTIAATAEPPADSAEPTVLQSSMADVEARRQMIATAAYFAAERRGFAAGGEMDDWLGAEAEIDGRLRA